MGACRNLFRFESEREGIALGSKAQNNSENYKDICLSWVVVDICCADERVEEEGWPQVLGLGPRITLPCWSPSPQLRFLVEGVLNQILRANSMTGDFGKTYYNQPTPVPAYTSSRQGLFCGLA